MDAVLPQKTWRAMSCSNVMMPGAIADVLATTCAGRKRHRTRLLLSEPFLQIWHLLRLLLLMLLPLSSSLFDELLLFSLVVVVVVVAAAIAGLSAPLFSTASISFGAQSLDDFDDLNEGNQLHSHCHHHRYYL